MQRVSKVDLPRLHHETKGSIAKLNELIDQVAWDAGEVLQGLVEN